MDKHRRNFFFLPSPTEVHSTVFKRFNVLTGFDGCLLLTNQKFHFWSPFLLALVLFCFCFNLQHPELRLKINLSSPEQPGGLNEQWWFRLTTFRGVLQARVVICEKRRLAFENLWDLGKIMNFLEGKIAYNM